MSDTETHDEFLARMKAYEGQASGAPFTARDAVNQAMIRHWADAMGDTNPVYVDEAAARATGRDGVIAPPTMLQAWTMRGLVPPDTGAASAATGFPALLAELDAAGFSSTVATNCEQTYHRELRIGDVITVSDVIENVSDEKQTALGRGHFVTSRITFTDQDGDVVGEQLWRILRFIPGTGAAPPPPSKPPRPRPAINRDNAFWFEGATEHRLLIQRCTNCNTLRHPPGPMCPTCHTTEWDTVESSGRGTLHSFVVNHYPQIPSFEYPLIVALIDLEEGTRLVSNLVDVEPGDVRIGMTVVVQWLDAGGDLTLPVFAPA